MKIALPSTRPAITHKFRVGGSKGYITVGLSDDGRPVEIFLTLDHYGSTSSGLIKNFALLLSIALRHEVPLNELCEKFRGQLFEPSGATGNPAIPEASSIIDYLFTWLEQQFPAK